MVAQVAHHHTHTAALLRMMQQGSYRTMLNFLVQSIAPQQSASFLQNIWRYTEQKMRSQKITYLDKQKANKIKAFLEKEISILNEIVDLRDLSLSSTHSERPIHNYKDHTVIGLYHAISYLLTQNIQKRKLRGI